MLIAYLVDRKSWVGLFAASLLLIDLLLVLDEGLTLSVVPLLYLNSLLAVLFVVFFLWRYRKETAYYRRLRMLAAGLPDDWLQVMPKADSRLQAEVHDLLTEIDRSLRLQLAALRESVSTVQLDTAAWVHEVKSPLTAMKLTIDANRDDPVVHKIESSWLHIQLLIDQQLYISRLPSLQADYVLEQSNVIRLAAEEVRFLMPWCLERNIAVELSEAADEVVTDQKWCRFIIRQLLTNAVKYSPAGGIVTITAEQDGAGRLNIRVTDEGPGIPAHEQARIFDRGFTGSAGRIHNAATGLGLFLARQAAGKIGISLHIEENREIGTGMVMTFPAENEFDATRM